ncbi:MAG TPA: hypothetical protein VEF71_19270 [Streptosporangiaceae bacterium]|nr:hypothetical protein [Streptosporangiaceae bacterium]
MQRGAFAARGGLTVLVGLAALTLAAAIPMTFVSGLFGAALPALAFCVPSLAVGVLVARRQPGNPLGWLFMLAAIGLLLSTDGGDYAAWSYRHGHSLPFGPAPLALDPLWAPALFLLVVMILLFPDGQLPSRSWRWALAAFAALYAVLVISFAAATVGALAAHPVRTDPDGGLAATDYPSGWLAAVTVIVVPGLVVLSVIFVARQAASWRRSSGERRQQLKWLASGAAVAVVSALAAGPIGAHGGSGLDWLKDLIWCGLAALPISMGVAILRYRLYDIDRIISRTLAYAIVTGLLAGVYAGLVLLATGVLAIGSSVAVAASTLVAVALFSPLRRRVQRAVDRRFNRARYDADQTIAAFAARLKDAVDLNSVRNDLATVVDRTLEPVHVSVWINDQGNDRIARLILGVGRPGRPRRA